tara:strand:+ start:503 stop:1411 length:909 start_codon:yes stop_codon:yes gene_type:complete
MIYDIVILTDSRYENPENTDWYIDQILLEDSILFEALKKNELKVIRKSWDAQDFDWSTCKFAIFRTTWDYFERYSAFFNWFEKTRKLLQFINVPALIYWNLDKHYLIDLKEKELNIPPTLFINKGIAQNLKELLEKTGWKSAVIKPAIGGAARETFKITSDNYAEYELHFKKLIAQEAMLFQEFQHKIVSQGEMSLIMIEGDYSHAVLKKSKKGDFRVQDDFGGSVEIYHPNKEEIEFAEKAISACPSLPLYGRVDIFYDNNNQVALGELELIEPELWFRNCPNAAGKLADSVARFISITEA